MINLPCKKCNGCDFSSPQKLKLFGDPNNKKTKNYMLMLVYKLLKIAPDGGEFANTTLGLLFGLMEAGLALWFLIEMLSNC